MEAEAKIRRLLDLSPRVGDRVKIAVVGASHSLRGWGRQGSRYGQVLKIQAGVMGTMYWVQSETAKNSAGRPDCGWFNQEQVAWP